MSKTATTKQANTTLEWADPESTDTQHDQTGNIALKGMTAEAYQVPKGEENYIHLLSETVKYDQKTGEDKSTRYIIKVNQKQFLTSMEALAQQHEKLTLLHEPKK